MAVDSPFKITWGSREVGGSSDTYQILGAHVIERSYTTFRLVFDVIVVSTGYANLQSLSSNLEADFSNRDQSLEIDLDAIDNPGVSVFTYTFGTTLLKSQASITKSGDSETDKGYSRAYTIAIEAELPAASDDGLRSVEANLDYESGRQKIVTMRGEYTSTASSNAYAQYSSDFDAEASAILTLFESSATWELVDESNTVSREKTGASYTPHSCQFSRQYVQLLYNQSAGTLDDTQIRDHRVSYTDLSQHPGDSGEGIFRLRRVACSFDCSIDIEQSTDLQGLWTGKVRQFILDEFSRIFTPSEFGVESARVSYDETMKRLSAQLQIVYAKGSGGTPVVESTFSVAFRESQSIDYTPVHDQGVFSQYADVGWAMRERITNRTVIVLGGFDPTKRIGDGRGGGTTINLGVEGRTSGGRELRGGSGSGSVNGSGWNIVGNISSAQPRYIGDPDYGNQILLTVLTDTITEKFNERPRGG